MSCLFGGLLAFSATVQLMDDIRVCAGGDDDSIAMDMTIDESRQSISSD